MDEVLRMDVDRALVILRGRNVLEVDKYDYSKHPESKKLHPSKAPATGSAGIGFVGRPGSGTRRTWRYSVSG